MLQVSIVIPTLNEANHIERTLRQLALLDPPPVEVLIVDGGSQDQTVTLAQAAGMQVLICDRRGRSVQMNHGAKSAIGDVVCFLHADTSVPDDLVAIIDRVLADPSVAGGGFVSLMAGSQTTRWGISLHNYLKTYYAPLLFRPHLFFRGLRLLFGDQVMFCRRSDFWECGGFDETLPIMEDCDLCLRLVQKGRLRQVNRVVQSSDRRVAHWGAWKATAIYLYIGVLWGVGVSADYLKKFYEDIR
ncbi:TIGR04283 family arsenosugar biosynthesis glycosyltransferase [Leptolyngbya sp. NIES-2104]|uniref:TIGR04283 family arsenosugar biosynthesis glycosyltransferase n=1 Tax=Leptolyngbya sp. NIES-2104 TaxID=1552121 RepID=UPI0006EC6ABF|nr:TIGR04283 family arsenosugar biosynthesis glycosyltransferase [Leptolyngbya sp. NIES-2104]GAP98221.1 glycosyl transferase-related protein [Leptolyngbya sp. NIES-2104]